MRLPKPAALNALAFSPAERRRVTVRLVARAGLLSLAIAAAEASLASPCDAEDFTHTVSGEAQCLAMRRFGDPQPRTLLVWLHGDVSSGGPANYHFNRAEKSATEFSAAKVLAVALVRPGYPDGDGRASTVALMHGGRSDHYTKVNVGEVGAAIERLREHYRPQSVVVVGHSGGAATAAVLLGLRPNLIDAAVLVACPCDLVAWRAGRRAWSGSENPVKWVDRVPGSARVIALTGGNDDNTAPALARDYVEALQARDVKAEFRLVDNENHNSVFRSAAVFQAIHEFLDP
ncbi:MAG TPA: alpha/beta fold hydrolase [Accumulibacter sp.]|jgi:pimeloyl-ACP methyl ester carboxylesterase|nr:alpha/beta fold hydrolase [Accumulibacter sp.]HQC81336.1 alpha/beta fold hydrolase [Accumulibacter sp.]